VKKRLEIETAPNTGYFSNRRERRGSRFAERSLPNDSNCLKNQADMKATHKKYLFFEVPMPDFITFAVLSQAAVW
jgi:hypothetical protein